MSLRIPYIKGPKRAKNIDFFSYIWPLARPNIAKRGAAIVEEAANFVNVGFWRLKAPETSIWAPEGAFGLIAVFPRRLIRGHV